jgi:hypothetical protein
MLGLQRLQGFRLVDVEHPYAGCLPGARCEVLLKLPPNWPAEHGRVCGGVVEAPASCLSLRAICQAIGFNLNFRGDFFDFRFGCASRRSSGSGSG